MPANIDEKKQARTIIADQKQALTELALKIHSRAETGLEEFDSSAWICEYLAKNGLDIDRGIGNLPTAFKASCGSGKPHIALLAEYDALPGLGHACGHNLIAAAAAGAAAACVPAVKKFGGKISVIGSPSEEFHSGKELLIRQKVFEDVDAAMMIHPGSADLLSIRTLACITLEVEFNGREAHASANPEEGANALEAMVLSFNAINALRQHTKPSSRIHGIITDGGHAANIVPAHSAARFMVRAADAGYLETLKSRVIACFAGAASATGTTLEYRWADAFCQPMRNNSGLAGLFQNNISVLGREMDASPVEFASTDMGNVSQLLPSIHPVIAIAPAGTGLHSIEFQKAAGSESGIRGMLDGALAMAWTTIDLLADSRAMDEVRAEFEQPRTGGPC